MVWGSVLPACVKFGGWMGYSVHGIAHGPDIRAVKVENPPVFKKVYYPDGVIVDPIVNDQQGVPLPERRGDPDRRLKSVDHLLIPIRPQFATA